VIDCIHADTHRPFTPCRIYDNKPCRPNNCKEKETMSTPATVYICGPMTGLPEHNYPAFHAEAKALRAEGHTVVNPAELDHSANETWEDHMKTDVKAMMDCDTICVLPGADNSDGATKERMIASWFKFDVITV